MARIIEKLDSRGGEIQADKTHGNLRLQVKIDLATETEADAWNAVVPIIPGQNDGFPLKAVQIDPQGAGIFVFTAKYEDSPENSQPKEDGEAAVSFDTTGGTAHISHSLETIDAFVSEATAAATGYDVDTFERGINVTRTSIEGVDITVPIHHFQFTQLIPAELITSDYIRDLRRLTGCVNDEEVWVQTGQLLQNFREGELRFDGARGGIKKHNQWEITFIFSAQDDLDVENGDEPIRIGDIDVTRKRGWDYLWVFSRERESQATQTLVRLPIAVMIERVYRYDNLNRISPTFSNPRPIILPPPPPLGMLGGPLGNLLVGPGLGGFGGLP